jgi:hypothetical protein
VWQSIRLFSWAPLLWLGLRRGLSEPGAWVLDRALSFKRLYRIPFLAVHTAANATVAALALSAIGVHAIFRERRYRDPRLHALAAILVLFGVAIVFSAHGEPPDLNRHVTTREIHIPLTLVLLLAAIGSAAFPRAAILLVAVGTAAGVAGSRRFLARETARPARLRARPVSRQPGTARGVHRHPFSADRHRSILPARVRRRRSGIAGCASRA